MASDKSKRNISNPVNEDNAGLFGSGIYRPNIEIGKGLQMIGKWIWDDIKRKVKPPIDEFPNGTGPYKPASFYAEPSLSKHTFYYPNRTLLPPDYKLPVILWGNGGCFGDGTAWKNFLLEISSHGYLIIANGIPDSKARWDMTKATDIPDAMDWVCESAGTGEYEHVDQTRIAVAGQSCGGIQALSASVDARVTVSAIFNSGVLNYDNMKYFEKLHAPIGYFIGGPMDIAYKNAEHDYAEMPDKIPIVKLNLPVGHGGTFFEPNGGRFGVAALAFFDWQMKGDESKKTMFLDSENSPLKESGWEIVSKNWTSES